MPYSYDRNAADYGQLARASHGMLAEMKKTRLQLSELRVASRAYSKAAEDWEHPRWTPEEGEPEIPDEADPYLVKKVEEVIKMANDLDKAIHAVENWEPPY